MNYVEYGNCELKSPDELDKMRISTEKSKGEGIRTVKIGRGEGNTDREHWADTMRETIDCEYIKSVEDLEQVVE